MRRWTIALMLAALALVVLLGTLGDAPDVCEVAENWRAPRVCD